MGFGAGRPLPSLQATPGGDPLSWTEPYHRAKDDYNTDYPWPWATTDKSRSWRAVPRSEVEERGPLQDTLEADWAIKVKWAHYHLHSIRP